MDIWCIRHGESTGNRDGRMGGVTADGLTPLGQAQAQALGRWWQATQRPPSHCYCSPLRRARETLAGMGQAGLWPEPEYCPDLQEGDLGIFTGLTWGEAQAQYPHLCAALESTSDWIPIPGAEGPGAGRSRAEGFLQSLWPRHGPGDRVVILSHQWLLEHLIGAILASDRTWQLPMGNTALFHFRLDGPGRDRPGVSRYTRDLWQIRYFGGQPHLQEPWFNPR